MTSEYLVSTVLLILLYIIIAQVGIMAMQIFLYFTIKLGLYLYPE